MTALAHHSIRVHPDHWEQITQHAQTLGLSRNTYLIKAALNRLPETADTLEQQLTALRERVDRLEELAYSP